MVDKLVSQTQETLKTVSLDTNHNKYNLDYASKVIKDAENSKHVSVSFFELWFEFPITHWNKDYKFI